MISNQNSKDSINQKYSCKNVPIDKEYRSRWSKTGTHRDHDIWMKGSHIIHGTTVGVDFELCNGCMKCVSVCPTKVFAPYLHNKSRIVDPVRESECILCLACELVCPTEALHVVRSGGSEETLDSLLG